MILVDSSVWIALLRREQTAATTKFKAIAPLETVLLGDLILLEILRGARDDLHAMRIEAALQDFSVASLLDPDLAKRAAGHYRALRNRGITIRKTADLIIGTFCIEHGHRLLHDDRDFNPMERHLGLKTL